MVYLKLSDIEVFFNLKIITVRYTPKFQELYNSDRLIVFQENF
jgi:hypothetical protein